MFGKWRGREEITEEVGTRSNAVAKKEEAMIKIYENPLLPALCRVIFIMMLLIMAAMLLVDLNAFLRYDSHLGMAHLFHNLSVTGFWGWFCFAAVQIPLSMLGMRQNKSRFRKRMGKEMEEQDKETRARNMRALKRWNRSYMLYIKVCIAGFAVWTTVYALFSAV